ncbi:MAG: hypothetical protein NVSMB25_02770 [Thermoleophilaceae bacterium]
MLRRVTLIGLAAALLMGLAGCGGSGKARRVVVALDFTPNAVHAPIYAAVRRGFDRANGLRLEIRAPGSGPDSLKLLASGHADVGVLDIHDLGLARERGADLVGIGALVQRPLAAIIGQPSIRRPRDLEGKRVGVSGLPSDVSVLRAVIQNDGGDVRRVHLITIGFAAVPSLIERKVDAVPAFWNAEGVTLRARGFAAREFRVDDYGAPRYPEVVLVATRASVERRRGEITAVLRAIRAGTNAVLSDPAAAARQVAVAGQTDVALVRAQLAAVAPLLRPPLELDRKALEGWASFDTRFGILTRRPAVSRAFQFDLVR